MIRFKHWLIHLPFIVLLAACMGWWGLILMYLATPYFPAYDDFWTRYLALASILIWGSLTFFLAKSRLQLSLLWGFLSPLLGCLLVTPPASYSFVIIKGYISFPFGVATWAMMWWVCNLFQGPTWAAESGISRDK